MNRRASLQWNLLTSEDIIHTVHHVACFQKWCQVALYHLLLSIFRISFKYLNTSLSLNLVLTSTIYYGSSLSDRYLYIKKFILPTMDSYKLRLCKLYLYKLCLYKLCLDKFYLFKLRNKPCKNLRGNLYKRLSTKRSLAFEGILITDSYKQRFKFLRLLYLNLCLKLRLTSNRRSNLYSDLCNKPLLFYRYLLLPSNC